MPNHSLIPKEGKQKGKEFDDVALEYHIGHLFFKRVKGYLEADCHSNRSFNYRTSMRNLLEVLGS